jgi:hypothetical protein
VSALAYDIPDAQGSAVRLDGERGRQLRAYRRICREIDRLLADGCLSEAQRLNDQARTLYRWLYSC